jgi:hypothetical protein
MQITRTTPYLSLPAAHEQPRERPATELTIRPTGVELRQATRAIEEIHSAERMLNRQWTQNTYGSQAQGGRQQRAVATYQLMQQSDERAYVSEVLGIDTYA